VANHRDACPVDFLPLGQRGNQIPDIVQEAGLERAVGDFVFELESSSIDFDLGNDFV
jgi:hypothetical protein